MTAVQYAAKCGEKLIQAKAACAHGEWALWLKDNCRLSQNQSAKYMKLFREIPSLSNSPSTVNFTGIEAAIAYLSASEEVKAEVDSSTEPVTEKLINDLKRQHSEEEAKAKEQSDRAEEWRKQYLTERDAKRAARLGLGLPCSHSCKVRRNTPPFIMTQVVPITANLGYG